MQKKKIVLLQHYFNTIGGIETFIINFVKTFNKEYEITIVCSSIDVDNAILLSDYADLICEPEEDIVCDICIVSSVLVDEKNFSYIKYKEIYQMIHSDWTAMKKFWKWEYKNYDDNTKFISVSDIAQKSFKREYGKDSIVIPNLLSNDCYRRKLKLISATRLTEEKGYDRMKKLCDLFDKYDIPYRWDVYGTNISRKKDYKGMRIFPARQNIKEEFDNYDYLVQLSDTESFCYSMYEALQLGLPVLVTPFQNAKDIIVSGKNGYIIPFDMNMDKQDVLNIYNNIPEEANYVQEGVIGAWKKVLN